MSIRGTVIMLLLCLGLGAFWYIHDYKGEEQRQEAKTQEERIFPGIKAGNIVGMRWTAKKDKTTEERVLKYDKGLWLMSAGDKAQYIAAVSETGDTVKQIAELSRLSVIIAEPKASDYATFSLDNPEAELELTVKDGETQQEKKLVLFIGTDTPAGDTNYVRVKDQQPILEAAVNFRAFFQERDIDVREKSGLVCNPDQVASLLIRQPGKDDIELRKSKDDKAAEAAEKKDSAEQEATAKWEVTKPQQVNADLSAVNDYLWQLHGLEVIRFIPQIEQERLGKLTAAWDIVTETGQTLKVELWGRSDSEGNNYYMRRPQTNEYMIASCKEAKNVVEAKSMDDFEDHHLAAFDENDIRRLELTLPAEQAQTETAQSGQDKPKADQPLKLDVRKIRDGWEVRQPEKCVRDEEKRNSSVLRLVYALTDLKWKEKQPGKSSELKGSCSEAIVYGEKDEVLAHFRIGAKGSGGGEMYGLTLEGQDTLFILDKDPVKLWRRTLHSLQEEEKKDKEGSQDAGKANSAAPAASPSPSGPASAAAPASASAVPQP
ncbi:MAG: DUF4340 domain-containing protein [bacterium]|nr:DUF4340 domain-containing protein [bacterium]